MPIQATVAEVPPGTRTTKYRKVLILCFIWQLDGDPKRRMYIHIHIHIHIDRRSLSGCYSCTGIFGRQLSTAQCVRVRSVVRTVGGCPGVNETRTSPYDVADSTGREV